MQHYSVCQVGGVFRREIRVDYPSIVMVAAKSADMRVQVQRMSAYPRVVSRAMTILATHSPVPQCLRAIIQRIVRGGAGGRQHCWRWGL